jgi:hypothetical protein
LCVLPVVGDKKINKKIKIEMKKRFEQACFLVSRFSKGGAPPQTRIHWGLSNGKPLDESESVFVFAVPSLESI